MNTRNVWISTSGASPGHDGDVPAMTPATKDPWPRPSSRVGSCVQLLRSLIFCTSGWSSLIPVSKTPIRTPWPRCPCVQIFSTLSTEAKLEEDCSNSLLFFSFLSVSSCRCCEIANEDLLLLSASSNSSSEKPSST